MEATLGFLTLATPPYAHLSAYSTPPSCPRLLSSGTESPTVHDISLLETLHAQIHGKLAIQIKFFHMTGG